MGSKTPTTTTNQSSTYTANPAVQSATQGLVGSAKTLSQNPYQAFTGQMVSPTTAQQQQGYNQVTQAAGIYSPYASSALGAISGIPQYNAATIQNYMSPYTTQVVQATEQQLNNVDAQQQAQLTGNAISAGAFGCDRASVAAGILGGQQDIANNATIAGLEQSGFQNAQSELNSQQQLGLQTGSAYSGLGTSALTNALTAAGANVQAGTQQQSTQTAIDQANYQLYQNALAYPYQNLSWLSSIIGGAGSTLGGTTQGTATTTQTGVSDIGSILGGVLGLGSLFLPKSDERVKDHIEVVGKLFDGSPVYRFRYKGEPTTQIGLMAQDVEKKHPEAVIKDPEGIRHLNYDIATADAARRKHFDAGGVVIPYGGGNPNGIIPFGSAASGANGGGQQMSDAGLQALNASGRPTGSTQPTSVLGQIGGVLQNKQSMQGLQAIYQFSGLQNAFSGLANDFSMPTTNLFDGSFRRGGIVRGFADGGMPTNLTPADLAIIASELQSQQSAPSDTGMRRGGIIRGFADGGAPYGDLSGVNFDPGPTPSSDYDFPLSVPRDVPLQGIQAAPVMSSPVPSSIVMPPQSAPQSGITAINNAAQPAPSPDAPRSVRNNNPGNLEDNEWTQGLPGYAGSDGRFAIFATPTAGANAMDANLQHYAKLGLTTPVAIASRWAPAGDGSNDPSAYGGFIAKKLGVGPNDPINMNDPAVRSQVGSAIAQFEGGPGPTANGVPGVALAYDGSAPSSGGISAPAPASVAASTSSNPFSGISQLFSNIVPHVTDAQRMGILGAGLGMMASRSPFPGQQIGEGGLAGIQAYMNATSLQREQAETQADVAYKMGSLQLEQRKADLLLQNAANIARSLNGGGSETPTLPYGGAGAPAPQGNGAQRAPASAPISAPSAGVTMPAGASSAPLSPNNVPPTAPVPNPSVPGDPNFWGRVAPSSNPAYLDQQASRYERAAVASAMVPEQAAQLSQIAMQYRRTAQQIRTNGQVTLQDGTQTVIPGFLESKAAIAGAEATAQNAGTHLQEPTAAGMLIRDPNNPTALPRLVPWSQIQGGNQPAQKISAGAPLDTRLLSPEGAKEVSAETEPILESAAKNNDAAQSTLFRVADMRNELTQLPTTGWLAPGSGFAERNSVAKDINTSLSMLGVPDKNLVFDANAVASGQALQKLTRTMGFDLARTLGSREAAMIINQAVGTVPSADNTPLGAKRLLSSIEQVAQRQIDWFNYAQQWSAETGGSLLGASAKFNADHPPEQYAGRALISTLPQGAVSLLRQKPNLSAQFDQKYGPGTSKLILGVSGGQ